MSEYSEVTKMFRSVYTTLLANKNASLERFSFQPCACKILYYNGDTTSENRQSESEQVGIAM